MTSPVRVSLRGAPATAEALVRDGEVLQTEGLAHEADLEVVWIHTDLGRQVWHIGYSNDRVVGHDSPFAPVSYTWQTIQRPFQLGRLGARDLALRT